MDSPPTDDKFWRNLSQFSEQTHFQASPTLQPKANEVYREIETPPQSGHSFLPLESYYSFERDLSADFDGAVGQRSKSPQYRRVNDDDDLIWPVNSSLRNYLKV